MLDEKLDALNTRFINAIGKPLPIHVGTFSGVIPDDDQTHVVWLSIKGDYRVSKLDDLSKICEKPAPTWRIRDAEIYNASVSLESYLDSRKEAQHVDVSVNS